MKVKNLEYFYATFCNVIARLGGKYLFFYVLPTFVKVSDNET